VALRIIRRVESVQAPSDVTAGLRRFALACAAPVIIAGVQLAFDLAQFVAEKQVPGVVWNLCYGSQAYYFYFVFAPLRKLLPRELRPLQNAVSSGDAPSIREAEYLNSRTNTMAAELTEMPIKILSQAQSQVQGVVEEEEEEAANETQVDFGFVYPDAERKASRATSKSGLY